MYIVAYLAYLTITIAVTLWVGMALRRNGRIFLVDAFHGDTELADSVNYLLVVGFYLVNLGFVALALRTSEDLQTARQAIELVCDKVGAALLVLGLMHFSNLYIFNRLRRRGHDRDRERLERRRPEHATLGRVLD
jgi:hypothetical protein